MTSFSRHTKVGLVNAVALTLVYVICPSVTLAQNPQPLVLQNFWTAWTWEPLTFVALLGASLSYNWGVGRLWKRAGRGHGIRRWQNIAFTGGLLALLIALISPLDALSGVLFSAHMLQHMLIMFVAAPLFAVSAAPMAILWSLPLKWRRKIGHLNLISRLQRMWSLLTRPLNAWILYAVVLWSWHSPSLYQAALENNFIHALEHLCFLLAAFIFWSVLFKPQKHQSANYGSGILYIFTTGLHSAALGALLLFSNQVWYSAYTTNISQIGLTPLSDQQLAGLIMWLPIGIVYLSIAALLLVLWLNALEHEMQQQERHSLQVLVR